VPYVVERIVQQGADVNKHRVFIPTGWSIRLRISSTIIIVSLGFQSKELIITSGLSLGDVDQCPTIDVTVDGADE
jgi:ribose 5-phosphate isomerase A